MTVLPLTVTSPRKCQREKLGASFPLCLLTIIVGFLEIHVDNPSRPHLAHLWAVESLHLSERTGLDLVASVLCKKSGHRVCRELLSAHIIARLSIRGVATPRVDVVTPKVDCVRLIAAIEVVRHVHADAGVIVGGVSNADGAIVFLLDIRLHVADGSLDKSARIGVIRGVGHLVASEEAENVGISRHGVDHARVARIQRVVPLRVVAIDGLVRRREVGNDIDASICQRGHGGIVVGGRVERVYTNDIRSELEKVRNIAVNTGHICERIIVASTGRGARHRGVAGVVLLICHTPEEAGAG